ncbi:MAG: transposase [Nonlabens sp.]
MTIWDWIDLFTLERYITILEDSFQYCIDHKGLIIYAYVIMPSHVHLLAASTTVPLNEIIRDLKKHTSKEFIKAIHEPGESRKK